MPSLPVPSSVSDNPLDAMDLRVLGVRLRAAREARAWTQQEVAGRLGVARTTLVAIEKGERRLKPGELIALAGLFGRPVSEFMQRREILEGFAADLRACLAPPSSGSEDLLPVIEEFERLCLDYRHLEVLCRAPLLRRVPPQYSIEGIDVEEAAEDAADGERRRLGLGDGPILNLREMLETDVGLRVFFPNMPPRVAWMFGWTEGLGGCIAVNRTLRSADRRVYLARAYGRYLTDRGRPTLAWTGRDRRRSVGERFSERFAEAFLLPGAGLRRRYLDLERERTRGVSQGGVLFLANYFEVPPGILIRRLEWLRLGSAGIRDLLRDRKREPEREFTLAAEEEPLLPVRFVVLLAEAWQRGDLSEGQAARLLRTDRVGARELVADFRWEDAREPEEAQLQDLANAASAFR